MTMKRDGLLAILDDAARTLEWQIREAKSEADLDEIAARLAGLTALLTPREIEP